MSAERRQKPKIGSDGGDDQSYHSTQANKRIGQPEGSVI